jgi:hypothetical protein
MLRFTQHLGPLNRNRCFAQHDRHGTSSILQYIGEFWNTLLLPLEHKRCTIKPLHIALTCSDFPQGAIIVKDKKRDHKEIE